MPVLGVAGNMIRRDSIVTKRQAVLNLRKSRRRRIAKARSKQTEMLTPKPYVVRPSQGTPPNSVQHVGSGRHRFFQLYALELEDGYFYVGMTAYRDVRKRFDQHASGKGARWTREHPPIHVIETRKLGLMFESQVAACENAMTIEYMERFGVHRVRGGDMCSVKTGVVSRRLARHRRRSS